MATPVPANNISPLAPVSAASAVAVVAAAMPTPANLETLLAEIYKCHDEAERHTVVAMKAAMQAGDLLIKAKEIVGHGKFTLWLTESCKIPERTARRYMGYAKHREEIEAHTKAKTATEAVLTFRQADKLITNSGSGKETGNGSGETTKTFGGNDPFDVVKTREDKFLDALKTLKENDLAKAKQAANAFLIRLKDLGLLSK